MTKRFEITDHSLKVAIKSPISYIEDEFPFEEITTKYRRKKLFHLWTLIPALLFLVLAVITVFSHFFEEKGSSVDDILLYAILGAVFLLISFFNFENVINLTLNNYRSLSFYATSPGKEEVDGFLELLFSEQKQYLLIGMGKLIRIYPRNNCQII